LNPGQLSKADGGFRQFDVPVFETSERARSGSVYPSENDSMDYSTSDVAIVRGQRYGLEPAAQMGVPIAMQPASSWGLMRNDQSAAISFRDRVNEHTILSIYSPPGTIIPAKRHVEVEESSPSKRYRRLLPSDYQEVLSSSLFMPDHFGSGGPTRFYQQQSMSWNQSLPEWQTSWEAVSESSIGTPDPIEAGLLRQYRAQREREEEKSRLAFATALRDQLIQDLCMNLRAHVVKKHLAGAIVRQEQFLSKSVDEHIQRIKLEPDDNPESWTARRKYLAPLKRWIEERKSNITVAWCHPPVGHPDPPCMQWLGPGPDWGYKPKSSWELCEVCFVGRGEILASHRSSKLETCHCYQILEN
jgi:hypothetical protein